MNQSVRFVGVLALAALCVGSARGDDESVAGRIEIGGEALQMMQLDGRFFERIGTDIKGLSFPVTLICPSDIDLSTGAAACAEPAGNGFQGLIVALENVVRRNVGDPDKPHTFMMHGKQMFTGFVAAGGKRYFGTFTLYMELTGRLRAPEGVDCWNEPENLACGAARFTGIWKILGGQGTGALAAMTGNGEIRWAGCTDPDDFTTCAFPVYTGWINLHEEE